MARTTPYELANSDEVKEIANILLSDPFTRADITALLSQYEEYKAETLRCIANYIILISARESEVHSVLDMLPIKTGKSFMSEKIGIARQIGVSSLFSKGKDVSNRRLGVALARSKNTSVKRIARKAAEGGWSDLIKAVEYAFERVASTREASKT